MPPCSACVTASGQREVGEVDDFATFLSRLMGADPDARPVGGGHRVRPGLAALCQGRYELIDQMRVRAAMAGALDKRQVIRVLDRARERTDGFREQVGEIGDLHGRRDFVFRFLGRVQHVRLAFHQGPLKTLLRAVHVKALAVLARRVVEESPDVCRDIGVLKLDVARFDGKPIARLLRDVFTDRAGSEARHIGRASIQQTQGRG